MKNTNRKPTQESFWNPKAKSTRRLVMFEPVKVKQVANSHSLPRMIKPSQNPFYLKPANVKVPVKRVVDKNAYVKNNQQSYIPKPVQSFTPRPAGSFVKYIPNKIRVVNDNLNVPKKEMNWIQAKTKYKNLNPFGDADKDGLMNYLDCKPFDKKRKDANSGPLMNPDDPFYNVKTQEELEAETLAKLKAAQNPKRKGNVIYENVGGKRNRQTLSQIDKKNKKRYADRTTAIKVRDYDALSQMTVDDPNLQDDSQSIPKTKKKSNKLNEGRVEIQTKAGKQSRDPKEGYGPLYPEGKQFKGGNKYEYARFNSLLRKKQEGTLTKEEEKDLNKLTNPINIKEAKRLIDEKVLPSDAPTKIVKQAKEYSKPIINPSARINRREQKRLDAIDRAKGMTEEEIQNKKKLRKGQKQVSGLTFTNTNQSGVNIGSLGDVNVNTKTTDVKSAFMKPDAVKAVETKPMDKGGIVSQNIIQKEKGKFKVIQSNGNIATFKTEAKAKEYKKKRDRIDRGIEKRIFNSQQSQEQPKEKPAKQSQQPSVQNNQSMFGNVSQGVSVSSLTDKELKQLEGPEVPESARPLSAAVRRDYERIATERIISKLNVDPYRIRDEVSKIYDQVQPVQKKVGGKVVNFVTNIDYENKLKEFEKNILSGEGNQLIKIPEPPKIKETIDRKDFLIKSGNYIEGLKSERERLIQSRKNINIAGARATLPFRNESAENINKQIQNLTNQITVNEQALREEKKKTFSIYEGEEGLRQKEKVQSILSGEMPMFNVTSEAIAKPRQFTSVGDALSLKGDRRQWEDKRWSDKTWDELRNERNQRVEERIRSIPEKTSTVARYGIAGVGYTLGVAKGMEIDKKAKATAQYVGEKFKMGKQRLKDVQNFMEEERNEKLKNKAAKKFNFVVTTEPVIKTTQEKGKLGEIEYEPASIKIEREVSSKGLYPKEKTFIEKFKEKIIPTKEIKEEKIKEEGFKSYDEIMSGIEPKIEKIKEIKEDKIKDDIGFTDIKDIMSDLSKEEKNIREEKRAAKEERKAEREMKREEKRMAKEEKVSVKEEKEIKEVEVKEEKPSSEISVNVSSLEQ